MEILVKIVALGILIPLFIFVTPIEIKGSSMAPTYTSGEYVLTMNKNYVKELKRGDIVIHKDPRNNSIENIKRIIGMPGDTILFLEGRVYVNDKLLDEPYILGETKIFPGDRYSEGTPITIENDSYFLMGDNRPRSRDSRTIGPVPARLIKSKALYCYYNCKK